MSTTMSKELRKTPNLFVNAKSCQHVLDWYVYVIIGCQWGDEGKGKLTFTTLQEASGITVTSDMFESDEFFNMSDFNYLDAKMICIRWSGGDNAGHTIVIDGVKYQTHLLPAGVFFEGCLSVIGPGCVVNHESLENEILTFEELGIKDIRKRLIIDPRCTVVTQENIDEDKRREEALGDDKIGTTCRGIAPAYEAQAKRGGPKVGDDEWRPEFEKLGILMQTDVMFNNYKNQPDGSKNLIIVNEGAQSIYLDKIKVNSRYVTSGQCIPSSIWTTDLPRNVRLLVWIGVMKAYATYVGGDKKENPEFKELSDAIRKEGHEYGVTTGRARQVLPFSFKQLNDIINMLSGSNREKVVFAINKGDVLNIVKERYPHLNPYIIEDEDGTIMKFKNLREMYNCIINKCSTLGIHPDNIRFSHTPEGDPSLCR